MISLLINIVMAIMTVVGGGGLRACSHQLFVPVHANPKP